MIGDIGEDMNTISLSLREQKKEHKYEILIAWCTEKNMYENSTAKK